MNRFFRHTLLPFLFLFVINCAGQVSVKPGNTSISYMGRVKLSQDSASFYWPGSSATINFTGGTEIKASMRSSGEEGFFYAILDGDVSKATKFETDGAKQTITLATNLPAGNHSLELYKLSNNTSENIFYGFEIDGNSKVLAPSKLPKRKIEFYGNSITAGHGVDVPPGMDDSGLAKYFNNYYTYASLTARHYNAQYSCIARSGIGIMLSWFSEIMPEIYDRLDPADPHSKWDFTAYTPDIVVINLFQNDYWLVNMPEHPEFKARFGTKKPTEDFIIQSYQNFVSSIRSKYPKAHIICALGNMNATEQGSKWPGYIRQAVSNMHDNKIYPVFFPYKNTPGHPKRNEQQAMADALISFIDKTIKW